MIQVELEIDDWRLRILVLSFDRLRSFSRLNLCVDHRSSDRQTLNMSSMLTR